MSAERRGKLEQMFDTILEDPEKYENLGRQALVAFGVEPNLETVLAFMSGLYFLMVGAKYAAKEDLTDEEKKEVQEMFDVIKRRSWEIRDAMIKTRMREDQ